MSETIEIGTVVRLKSGGPRMVVVSRVEGRGDEAHALCRCLFFSDGKMSEVMVPVAALSDQTATEAGELAGKAPDGG